MSDSVRSHRRQPIRLLCPWDSPGKNTGVGCHFLLQCMKVKSESEVAQSCLTLSDPRDCSPPGSSVHGIFQARGLEWGAIAFSAAHFLASNKNTVIPSIRDICSLGVLFCSEGQEDFTGMLYKVSHRILNVSFSPNSSSVITGHLSFPSLVTQWPASPVNLFSFQITFKSSRLLTKQKNSTTPQLILLNLSTHSVLCKY